MKRGLVVSGGGAKGAYATGVIDYLYNDLGLRYNLIVGVSTGSLVMPLTALGLIDGLKEAYTSVNNKDLWDYNPFKKNGKISALKVLWREIQGKSWGDMGGLRRIIRSWFSEDDYNKILESDIEMVACATNVTNGSKAYFSNKDLSYDYFVEAMMASSAYPVFTDTVRINGYKFSDGGIREHVPLQYAIERGCDHIDVIVNRAKNFKREKSKIQSGTSQLTRLLELQNYEISENDINQHLVSNQDVKINIIYTPHDLTGNSINFNKEEMRVWQELGYNTALKIFGADSLENKRFSCENFFKRRRVKER